MSASDKENMRKSQGRNNSRMFVTHCSFQEVVKKVQNILNSLGNKQAPIGPAPVATGTPGLIKVQPLSRRQIQEPMCVEMSSIVSSQYLPASPTSLNSLPSRRDPVTRRSLTNPSLRPGLSGSAEPRPARRHLAPCFLLFISVLCLFRLHDSLKRSCFFLSLLFSS